MLAMPRATKPTSGLGARYGRSSARVFSTGLPLSETRRKESGWSRGYEARSNFVVFLVRMLCCFPPVRQGRLYFQAGNEVVLQKWLVALRTLVKFFDLTNDKRQ